MPDILLSFAGSGISADFPSMAENTENQVTRKEIFPFLSIPRKLLFPRAFGEHNRRSQNWTKRATSGTS
jgi:hypothetical protein